MLYAPLSTLSYLAGSISSARAAIDRVIEVLDEHPEVHDREGARAVERPVAGSIELRGVSFGYGETPCSAT